VSRQSQIADKVAVADTGVVSYGNLAAVVADEDGSRSSQVEGLPLSFRFIRSLE
jgi:hypothetical protein